MHQLNSVKLSNNIVFLKDIYRLKVIVKIFNPVVIVSVNISRNENILQIKNTFFNF